MSFDIPYCRRNFAPLEFCEVNWFLNGIRVSGANRFSLVKQKDLAVLHINRITSAESGLLTFQLVGKSSQAMASLNVEVVNEKIESSSRVYELVNHSKNEWSLKEKGAPLEEKPVVQEPAEPAFTLISQISPEYKCIAGQEFRC